MASPLSVGTPSLLLALLQGRAQLLPTWLPSISAKPHVQPRHPSHLEKTNTTQERPQTQQQKRLKYKSIELRA